jgi:hypothetical protein
LIDLSEGLLPALKALNVFEYSLLIMLSAIMLLAELPVHTNKIFFIKK